MLEILIIFPPHFSPYCQRRNIKRQFVTGTEISNDSESSIAFNYGNFTLLNIIKQDLSCNRILFFNDLHHRVRYILLSQNRNFYCVFFCRLFFWQIFGTDTASPNQHLQNCTPFIFSADHLSHLLSDTKSIIFPVLLLKLLWEQS